MYVLDVSGYYVCVFVEGRGNKLIRVLVGIFIRIFGEERNFFFFGVVSLVEFKLIENKVELRVRGLGV